ncbi:MAG: VOC family protein [Alphaproteobacteria bacterium]
MRDLLILDHIIIAALNIEEGVAYAENILGVSIPTGGRHLSMGTHNHLLRLGDRLFLEVISPDPQARPLSRKRWFDLDNSRLRASLTASPRIITWVARTISIADALASVVGSAGPAIRVARGDLSWLISVPDDGSMPFDGAFPTLIEWPQIPHPASNMVDQGCKLVRFTVEHPQGDKIANLLSPFLKDERIIYKKGPTLHFEAEISTDNGLCRLC